MDEEPPRPGIRSGAMRLAATLVDIGHTRLQLAATELEEERLRLTRQALCAAAALFFGALGLVAASAWLVLASPPEHRLLVLGLIALLFLGLSAAGLVHWQRLAARKPPLLQATLAELRRDAAWLRPAERQS